MSDRRGDLQSLRDRLKSEIDAAADPRDVATLSKELRAVWSELDQLPVPGSKAPADEIARRREERRRKAVGE